MYEQLMDLKKNCYSFYYYRYFFIFSPVDDTNISNPREFCNHYRPKYKPQSSHINLDLGIGTSNMTDRHYDADPRQTSASTYDSVEKTTYKFLLTKEEEVKEDERRKNNLYIRMR